MNKLRRFYIRVLYWQMWGINCPFSLWYRLKALLMKNYSGSFEMFIFAKSFNEGFVKGMSTINHVIADATRSMVAFAEANKFDELEREEANGHK